MSVITIAWEMNISKQKKVTDPRDEIINIDHVQAYSYFCVIDLKVLSKNRVNNSLHLWSENFHSLRSEFHSILTPVEWKFTTQRVESRPVHSIFTPKEVITEVTPQGVISVTNRVKIHSMF